MTRLRFVGTGASGGTAGEGRSRRREASLLIEGPPALLIDATRDVDEQLDGVERLDAVLLTHAHGDAAGGIARVGSWAAGRGLPPLPLIAHPAALARLTTLHGTLEGLDPRPLEPGGTMAVGGTSVCPVEVPHASDPVAFPTVAWRIETEAGAVVYASDVARLTPELEAHARGAAVLVVDAATYGRPIPTHLCIDRDLRELCEWRVELIVLTQMGRSVPPHDRLVEIAAELCHRAVPAYDGMVVDLS